VLHVRIRGTYQPVCALMSPTVVHLTPAGFHTFDYARHFLSCCSRMLGLEHETSRGSITIDYYGRTVGIKIMPTGVGQVVCCSVRVMQ
jgi:trehalose-6-phosphate synthase